MTKYSEAEQGIRRLIQHYRNVFRLPENTQHYLQKDYEEAERKFVKYCLRGNSS